MHPCAGELPGSHGKRRPAPAHGAQERNALIAYHGRLGTTTCSPVLHAVLILDSQKLIFSLLFRTNRVYVVGLTSDPCSVGAVCNL